MLHVPGAAADDDAGDRDYLVLAKPNVIMNDTRRCRSEEYAQPGPDRSQP